MKTRCKCCLLPENIRNIVDVSIIKKISYRDIIASINPMLEGRNKLTINNLSDHKRHIIDTLPDPDTGLVMADAAFYQEMRSHLKAMTINQSKLILEIQTGNDPRAKRNLPAVVEVLRKLWGMSQTCISDAPPTPINYLSIDELLKDVKSFE